MLRQSRYGYLAACAFLGSSVIGIDWAQGTQQRPDPFCADWASRINRLPPQNLQTLNKYGVVSYGDLLLSTRFVEECELRLRLGEYWGRVISGNDGTRNDRVFASSNSATIAAILLAIWPITSDPQAHIGDGGFHSDRYNMLADPNLDERDLAPVLAKLLASEHISLEFAYVLMNRSMPRVKAVLWDEFRDARKQHDFVREVLSLASLQRSGEDINVKLKMLTSSRSLTDEQRKYVRKLAAILERRTLQFGDVEGLAYDDLRKR